MQIIYKLKPFVSSLANLMPTQFLFNFLGKGMQSKKMKYRCLLAL